MVDTKVLFKEEAREAITAGVNIMADAVETSLGPRGNNVGISRSTTQGDIYERVILHDGVSIGRAVDLKDESKNFGARVLLEAAQKSVDEAGDGTTVTISLARALYIEAIKRASTGINPMQIKKEIEQDIDVALQILEQQAQPVTTLEQKVQVATISSEEKSLGLLIGETIHKVGDDGVVTVEQSKNGETYVEMQEGMQWDRGLVSPYFITDPNSMTGTVENGKIFVTDFEIENFKELMPLLTDLVEQKGIRFFTIVAPEFGGDALPSLIANKTQGKFMVICVKAPSTGEQQTNMLQDLAILTGATFITKQQGHKLEDVRAEHLGTAERVSASQLTALVAGGKGDKATIKSRIAEVKALLKDETSEFNRERLRERIAKLTNGVAVIKVGGKTDIEIKERYERALDAALATRQAVKRGIVAGGEIVFLSLLSDMKSEIVKNALKTPFKRLVENAGYDSGEILNEVKKRPLSEGFDVITGEYVNMIDAGIIDPVQASISALQNAASVAVALLTTESIIIPDMEAKKADEK